MTPDSPLLPAVATRRFLCDAFHTDFTGRLRLSMLGNNMLNLAEYHASARGFGMMQVGSEQHAWVLSRMAIECDEMPEQMQTYELDTWVESVYRLFTDRNFRVRRSDGRVIGYGRSVWAMIGLQSRRPVDVMTIVDGLVERYVEPGMACPIDKPGRIKVSATEPSASFTARYSDIDLNGHVNSIRYIEHIMDLCPLDYMAAHRLRRFEIAYVSESHYGDTLDLYVDTPAPGLQTVEMRRREGGAVICRAAMTFSDLPCP